MEDKESIKKNYKSIDCLKFVLSIFVIGIHTPGPFSGTPFGLGIQIVIFTLAVPLFFAITGFFFYGKLQKNYDTETIKHYCWRLGKLYLVWTLLYIPHIIIDYQNHQGWGMLENGIVVLIRNIFFLGSYNQLWYLLAAIWGGILLSCCVKALKDWKKIAVLCILVCVIAMLFDSCTGIWPAQLRIIPTMYRGIFKFCTERIAVWIPFFGGWYCCISDAEYEA